MVWKCIVVFLLVVDVCRGGVFDTQTILEDAAGPIVIVREGGGSCYRNVDNNVLLRAKNNNFLDMVNFMEYTQQSKASGVAPHVEAKNYYEVARAAMEAENTMLSQENIARALGAIARQRRFSVRTKRSSESGDYGNMTLDHDNVRMKRSSDVGAWDASHLFSHFKKTMGVEKFRDVLHLTKKVTIAFVIDTSSSMDDDMSKVRMYINQLLQEQADAGVEADYIVTTFAEAPDSNSRPQLLKTAAEVKSFIYRLRPSIGGDCEERTCHGILSAIYRSKFMRMRNSVMYVFTDASSKDCTRSSYAISRNLSFLKAPVFFILFGTCKHTIDSSYVQMAQKSGGFCLLIEEKGVYNITDTVNGAFDKDALICGEESDNSQSVVGQGGDASRKKRSTDEEAVRKELEKTILIDTSIEKFKVIVSVTPAELLSEVRLEKPADGDSERCGIYRNQDVENVKILTSTADNSVVFDVSTTDCPCTGEWKIKYPAEADKSLVYSVKSSGEFLVGFESYFVDRVGSTSVANYAPCIGIEENLVIKINQGEKVNINTLKAKIVGVAGNVVRWEGALAEEEAATNAFVVTLTLPTDLGTDGFRVVLEGELIDGTKFQRYSTMYFYPTTSCFRIVSVSNYYALTPLRKTILKMTITNNNAYEDLYLLSCSNTENYDVSIGVPTISGPRMRTRKGRSNPVLLDSLQSAEFMVNIIAPRSLKRGRMVTVTCRVTTSTDEILDIVRLTEMQTRF